ncbi:radical SAM protein [Qingrenia yutianensis]|uniref:Radical SAM protein n=1 Tax=Qingrenia yutianensis TaxID=2763676 RepID=A0A926FDD2_9FIRM|nr:radical SAM protein [Qingrenia yutianensis]MBC8597152.1 radical SAM protein [Qingrenia yutianensis]
MKIDKKLELVHFQLTRNCNLRCEFCGQWGKKGFFSNISGSEMSLADWKNTTDMLCRRREKTGENPSVMLWGGEPLAYPYFDEIADYLKKHGFTLGIVTNGTLINRHKSALESGFKSIYLSVDGDEALHDKIRGKGVFKTVLNNIDTLKTDAKLTVMTVVTKELVQSFSAYASAVEKFNPDEIFLQDMIALTNREVENYRVRFKKVFSKDAVYVDSWVTDFPFRTNKNLADSKNYPFKITTKKHGIPNKYGHCLSPFKHICIAWNGEVMHCTDFYDFSAGNVKIDDISNIFDNKLSEKFRSEIVNGKCVLCNHCSWLNNDSFDV